MRRKFASLLLALSLGLLAAACGGDAGGSEVDDEASAAASEAMTEMTSEGSEMMSEGSEMGSEMMSESES